MHTGGNHDARAASRDDGGALEAHAVLIADRAGIGRAIFRILQAGHRLASERGFFDAQLYGIEQAQVGRYDIADGKQHDISRYQFDRRHRDFRTIPAHLRERLGEGAECGHCAVGAKLLGEAERRIEDHDRHDRERVFRFADDTGDDCGDQQHDHHRVGKLGEQHAQYAATARVLQRVLAVLERTSLHDIGSEAALGGTPERG